MLVSATTADVAAPDARATHRDLVVVELKALVGERRLEVAVVDLAVAVMVDRLEDLLGLRLLLRCQWFLRHTDADATLQNRISIQL